MVRKLRYDLTGLLAALATVSPAFAQQAPSMPDGQRLAQLFGARESVQSMSISPDGTHVVFVSPAPGGQRVLVADMVAGGTPRPVLSSDPAAGWITGCHWPNDTRLICELLVTTDYSGVLARYSRLLVLDRDGSHVGVLTARPTGREVRAAWQGGEVIDWTGQRPGEVLLTREFVPEATAGTNMAKTDEGLGVESVDVSTLQRRTIEKARLNAEEYLADGAGNVRIMGLMRPRSSGYDSGVIDYYYRNPTDRDWKELGKLDGSNGTISVGFEPKAVDAAQNAVYGFVGMDNGRTGLARITLDGSNTRQNVLVRDDVDVDDIITIGRAHRVVGASYATDRRQVEFFDPALRKLAAALGRALPNTPQVGFIDASADESRLLLYAGADTDPGMFYLYDKNTHKLEQIVGSRPDLAGIPLASMTPITFSAADGTQIPGYLTLPPQGPTKGLPAIVMPHGGPSARDEWGFDWLVQFFAARGFAVLQPNYRGSSGYGVDWFQDNGFQSWRTAIGDIDDAGRWLVSQGIAAPGKLAIFGWSYGGYAGLQSAVTEPGLFKAVVAVAPVTDLDKLRNEAGDFSNGVLVDRMIGHGPHVAAGSPALHAANITVPVLLFHGNKDLNVAVDESRTMAKRLRDAGKTVDYVEFPGLDHQLQDAAARTTLLSRSDAFIRQALGIAP